MAKSQSRRCCLCVLAFMCTAAVICICIILRTRQRHCDFFTHAAVSADSQLCSDVGRDMLLQGGSAVDAAIAALLCTGVVNPQSMGLGGGSIFTIMDKTGKVTVISSRETVPKGVKADLLKRCPKSLTFTTGSEWIGVPGELRGYQHAHRLYGKLPWDKLFQPTIKLAREGFPMPTYLGKFLQYEMIKQLIQGTKLCDLFCHKNKTVFGPGDVLRFPKLAETMEIIAKEGADAFYTGKIARDLIDDVKAAGGTLSEEDLKAFQVRVSDAWSVQLGDYKMHFPPPPAGGTILSFILQLMHGFGLSPASINGDQKKVTLHRYLEAAKFANGQKRNLGDPFFNSRDMTYMTDKKFTDRIRALITDGLTHDVSYYNVTPSADHYGTTHVSVMAADGSAVSVTSTINHMFGSSIYSNKTGIILNNELADFCGKADSVTPGEQPPSSMAPSILQSSSQRTTLVMGGSGGSMITTAMALSIMNHLWFGMSLNESIAEKIVFVNSKNAINFERGYDNAAIEAMAALGHVVEQNPYFFNVVNGISKEGHCISAVSDARKVGKSAGY
ncbi:glutathione hydrolase 5 proenzyme isoform X2 [Triplophysa rosa]|uniref:Glutathione hydrolase n=1 Tax=Triplophysa rosa TaxID=992332 RepID=A0A9W7TCA4_TRIRA|nr:glutathione hydrolase 5 proenzyme isoform X2 [Triplophysa rosa]KAI7793494.1 putative gamma-glutamyltransferase 5 [Triplophysa rosa]